MPFDYSTAKPYNNTPKHVEVNRDVIEAKLRETPEAFVCWLYSEIILEKGKGYIGNVNGTSGQSLVIDLKGPTQGRWYDFASGEGGGDFIGLYAGAKSYGAMQFTQALSDLADWASIAHTFDETRRFVKRSSKAHYRKKADIGPIVGTWYYHDPKGKKISEIRRHEYIDHKGRPKKEFIPFTYNAGDKAFHMPKPRHVYNAHLFNSGDQIVFCEGEKTADAITALNGYVGTSLMGGAMAIDQSDYSSLIGKSVILWRDNDEAGKSWQIRLSGKLISLGIKQTGAVVIPEGVTEKWDAADCTQGVALDLLSSTSEKETSVLGFHYNQFPFSRYIGEAKKMVWLIENIYPLGVPVMLASSGGIGKSFKALEIAIGVASDVDRYHNVLGGPVVSRGSCVMITGEDSFDSIHRRLASILTNKEREEIGKSNNLHIIPTVSCGGTFPLVAMANNRAVKTPEYYALIDQLLTIKDLKLIIIDPLQAFIAIDVNKDPAMGQFVWSALGEISAITGATLMATHHMGKTSKPIQTIEDARNAVRGSTALLDGPRIAYALWPTPIDDAKDICSVLEIENARNKVIWGAVVKANDEHDSSIHQYVRGKDGLLKDASMEIKDMTRQKNKPDDYKFFEIFTLINKAWKAGSPLSHYSQAKSKGNYLPRIIVEKGLFSAGGAVSKINEWLDFGLIEIATGERRKSGLRVTEKGMKYVKN